METDDRFRGGLSLEKTPYPHMLRMPLAEANLGAGGQADGFGKEGDDHDRGDSGEWRDSF